MDISHLPGQQQADEEQDRQRHAERQGPGHAPATLPVVLAGAHHEEQRRSKAGENGKKTQGNKHFHESHYPVTSIHSLKKRAAFWLVTLAALVGIVLTAALGRWQLARAAQKEALAAEMVARSGIAPLGGAELRQELAAERSGGGFDHLLYRPVQLHGYWLPDYVLYLDNRPMNGHQGFFVLTPLQLKADKTVVLVQRGWIPRNFQDRNALAVVDTPAGEVEVSGHLAPEPAQTYSLGSSAKEPGFLRIRQNLGLSEFRSETGLPLAALAVVQEGGASQGLLRDWAPISTGVEKNYGYAFQWFALCGLILVLYVWFQFIRPRRRA